MSSSTPRFTLVSNRVGCSTLEWTRLLEQAKALYIGRDSGAVCCGRLPPDDVVYFDDFRLARVDTELLKNRHEARAERIELLLSVPNLADLKVVARAEANLVIQPVRGHDTVSSEPADGTVVLISGQRRWRKANEHTQGGSSRCG